MSCLRCHCGGMFFVFSPVVAYFLFLKIIDRDTHTCNIWLYMYVHTSAYSYLSSLFLILIIIIVCGDIIISVHIKASQTLLDIYCCCEISVDMLMVDLWYCVFWQIPLITYLHHLFLIFLTGYAVLSSLLIFNHLCVSVKTATSLTITSYGSPFHLHWFFFLGRCCWNTSINLWIWSFTKFSCFLLFPSVCWRI